MSPERSLIARVIDRPVTVLMLFLSLVGTGVIAYTRIPVNLLPEGFSSNYVSILIPSPDSSPVENEDKITKPVEEAVRSIPGIKEVRSLSGDFGSRINVEFGSRSDIDLAYMEVKDRIERVKHNFPENADRYYCFRFNLDTDLPVLAMAVMYGKEVKNPGALAEDVVKSRLEGVDGVAEVNVEGLVDEAVRVFLDPVKAEGHKVNLYDLVRRMATDNFALPAGRIVDGERRYNLRIDAHYRNLDEVERYPVTPDLEVGDLGRVVRGRRLRDHMVRVNGKEGLFFFISKESQKNTVEVCSSVEEEIEALKGDPRLENFEFLVFFNQKEMIESSLRGLKTSMAWGGLFALIVLFAFLRHVRATLIVALAIPMSILMALVAVYFTGHTINILSLSGFTLAVGMLVDNAIVVTENIFRRRAGGLPPADASARGAGEVATAIVMATLTTIVVFLPLIFLQDDREIRLVLGEIGLPISFSLIASLVSALAFIPLATTFLIRKGQRREEAKEVSFLKAYHGRGRAARLYEGGMRWVLDHRFGAVLIALVLLSTNQAASMLTDKALGESSEGGGVTVRVELPTHFTLDEADAVFKKLEGACTAKEEEFKTEALVSIFDRRGGRLVFYPRDEADTRFRRELPGKIRKALPSLPGVRYDMQVDSSNETKKEFRLEISGPDSGLLARIAFDLKERLRKIPEITNVRTDIEKGNDEVRVEVNRETAALFNVDPQVLRGVVAWGLGGQRLPDYVAGGDEVRMQLEYEEKPTESLETIRNMAIPTAGGARLPLASVAALSVTKGPAVIQRQDGRTTMGITATPLTDNVYTVSRKVARVMEDYAFPHDYSWVEKGGTAAFEEKAREIQKAFAMSVILVFILMGILFESFTLPLTVLVSIPFAILGGMWLLCLSGLPLDVNGMVGFILLAGIVVNNAIVLIDHINRLRRGGLDRREAVIRGGRERLRPIFMTALTTISGLLPMAMPTLFAADEGGGVFSYRTLAVVVLGGLALSTFFTLFVVPLAYTLLDDLGAVLKGLLIAPLLKTTTLQKNTPSDR